MILPLVLSFKVGRGKLPGQKVKQSGRMSSSLLPARRGSSFLGEVVVSFQAEVEFEEIQGAGDFVYNQMCVPEATVENGRELVLGVSQESRMGCFR